MDFDPSLHTEPRAQPTSCELALVVILTKETQPCAKEYIFGWTNVKALAVTLRHMNSHETLQQVIIIHAGTLLCFPTLSSYGFVLWAMLAEQVVPRF
ncbi:hypothetical protein EDB92DRAFT_1947408 [Lactarius akahatsu]|uniref:Uncharacterized protein n=1 Tax=Lactarius akahatsu TaxID=416441 RepID=A0AAD4LDG9_9AGAM|nr:hypothetical protein EDB92DRAFT_1947408 [Lactarius akahatsu]